MWDACSWRICLNQFRDWSHMPCPNLPRKFTRVILYAVRLKVLADAFNITLEQREHIRVVIGIDCLREVNQCHGLLPVEDVVLREVAMNATMGKSQLDVAYYAVKERLGLLLFKYHITEPRGRFPYIPDVFHQDGVPNLRKSAGHIGAMGVEQTLSLVFILDPGR